MFCYILGTFTTINVTYEVLPDQLCITCTFLDLATNFSCHGVITATNKKMFDPVVIVINQSDDLNMQCSKNLSTGVYQLTVYDVDDNETVSSVPVFVYHNIFIPGVHVG